ERHEVAAVEHDGAAESTERSRPHRLQASTSGRKTRTPGWVLQRATAGYLPRTSSTNAASRSASAGSEISSTFSAFSSPECERLKLPTKTRSSATVTFACMQSCTVPGPYGVECLPENG